MAELEKPEGTMEFEAMMEVYRKLATPGAPHKLLASRAGRWSTRNRYWMEPDKLPVETTGTCERKMLLDGRYLQEDFSGEMMGGSFSGVGFTGYDNQTGKYVMAWMDSLSTGIYLFGGTASEDHRTITLETRYDDPVRGPMKLRGIIKLVDENTEIFEMHATDTSGKVEKCETVYTRTP
ncbi:MAG: DUF1579 domain-containing protein [Syntrophobacteraceae bacterium]